MDVDRAVCVQARSPLERAGLERIAASAGLRVGSATAITTLNLQSGYHNQISEPPLAEGCVASIVVTDDELILRLPQPIDPAALNDVIALLRAAAAR